MGKCVLNLKLVGEEQFPIGENISWKPLENDEIFPQLPNSNPFMDFVWRVRVDVRCGVDLPLNRNSVNGLPSCYVGKEKRGGGLDFVGKNIKNIFV